MCRGRGRWALRGVGLRAAVSGLARGVRRVRVRAVAAIAEEQDYTDGVYSFEVLSVCISHKPLRRT